MPLVTAGAHPVLSSEAGGADDEVILVLPDAGPLKPEVILHGEETATIEHVGAWPQSQCGMLPPDPALHHDLLVHDALL
jgi:hypothetical protein